MSEFTTAFLDAEKVFVDGAPATHSDSLAWPSRWSPKAACRPEAAAAARDYNFLKISPRRERRVDADCGDRDRPTACTSRKR